MAAAHPVILASCGKLSQELLHELLGAGSLSDFIGNLYNRLLLS